MTSPFVTVEEMAEILRVPVSRIYEWTRTRAIPCYWAGKRLVFDRDEAEAWFRETQQAAPDFQRRSVGLRARRRKRAPKGVSAGRMKRLDRCGF